MLGDRAGTVYAGAIGKDAFGDELKAQVDKVSAFISKF